MNRTSIYLVAAAALAVVALVVGMPRLTSGGSILGPKPTPMPPVITTNGSGSLTLTARVSHPFIVTGVNDVYVTADIVGQEVPGATRVPVNLALVIDRSGSMAGEKLANAKDAARRLVGQLRSTDRLAIVHYGSDVRFFDGVICTEDNKAQLLKYIDGIWDEGGTNIGDGLTAGRAQLLRAASDYKVNRMILISDGQPTEGLTDLSALTQEVRDIRNQGISVSSIGVGTDFNEQLMEAFAEVGSGAYAFLSDSSQLSSIFQKDLNAAGTQVARNVTLTFNAPPSAQIIEVLGHTNVQYSDRGYGNHASVTLPDFAAAQQERVVVRMRVRGEEVGATVAVDALSLTYQDTQKNDAVSSGASLSALVTGSVATMNDNRDKEAIVFAARARSADNLQHAAAAMQAGDRKGAQGFINSNNAIFEEAAQVAGEGAVDGDRKDNAAVFDSLNSADDTDKINSWSKESRRKARMNYGLMGSTY